jgi:lysozyme
MVNEATLKLIKEFEGVRLKAYPDPATGGEPWTIGVGHTGGVKRGDVITMEQSDAFLRDDLKEAQQAVDNLHFNLTENQYGALVSFTFNTGPGNLRKLAGQGIAAIPARLLLFNHANGKVMKGLTRRRQAERALFLS